MFRFCIETEHARASTPLSFVAFWVYMHVCAYVRAWKWDYGSGCSYTRTSVCNFGLCLSKTRSWACQLNSSWVLFYYTSHTCFLQLLYKMTCDCEFEICKFERGPSLLRLIKETAKVEGAIIQAKGDEVSPKIFQKLPHIKCTFK
jgi:hypothetical protein